MRYNFTICVCFSLSLITSLSVKGQLSINTGLTPTQLAQQLVGQGISISNVVVNCDPQSRGYFDATSTNLGVSNGLFLGSCYASSAIQSNAGGITSSDFTSGQPYGLLNNIAQATTYDACIFEFDILPLGDTISFNFTFASEEYDEYVCSGFNDAFGFFLSGPNPLGGNWTNRNLAVVPNTNTPITINSVNNGSVGSFGSFFDCISLSNSSYYQSNNGGNTHVFDGFTRNLVARSAVVPCSSYHLILAIADGGDPVLDSGVFIEEITSNSIDVDVTTAGGNLNAIEGCNDGLIIFSRNPVDNTAVPITFQIAGSATNGVDYQAISNTITIPPNQADIQLPIVTINDGVTEPIEKITVYLISPCTNLPFDTASIFLLDKLTVTVDDTVLTCGSAPAQLNAIGTGIFYNWSPPTGLSNPNIPNPTATVSQSTTYIVTNTLANCTATDTTVVISSNAGTLIMPPNSSICAGQSTTLSASGGTSYSWSPTTGLSNPLIANPIASPTVTTTYTLTVIDLCGDVVTGSVTVTVGGASPGSISGLNPEYCIGNDPVTLSISPPGGTLSGSGINPNTNTFDPALAGLGQKIITYSYNTAGCNNIIRDTTLVRLGPNATLSGLNSQYCNDDLPITLSFSPQGGTFLGPITAVSVFDPSVQATGVPITIRYLITDTTGCADTASLSTIVYPVPNPTLSGIDPQYCVIFPSGSNPVSVPVTVSPAGGSLSGMGVSGLTFSPQIAGVGTHTLTYAVSVNGCSNQTSFTTGVYPIPVVTIAGLLPAYCEDDPASLIAVSPPGGTWTSGSPLPAFNPSDSTIGNYTFTYLYADPISGCSDTLTVQSVIHPNPITTFALLDSQYCSADLPVSLAPSPPGGSFSGVTLFNDTLIPALTPLNTTLNISYSYTDTTTGCSASFSQSTIIRPSSSLSLPGLDPDYCSDAPADPVLATATTNGVSILVDSINNIFYITGPGYQSGLFNPSLSGEGSFLLQFSFVNQYGCLTDSSFPVLVYPLPEPIVSPVFTEICEGESATLFSDSTFIQYAWSTGGNSQTLLVTQSGIFDLTVTDINGCVNVSNEVEVIVYPIPQLTVSLDTTIYMGFRTPISVESDVVNSSLSILWNPDYNISCLDCNEPIVAPLINTPYAVSVTVDGCTATDTVFVYVRELIPYVPSGFSPNGDGVNDDVYVLQDITTEVLEFKVFNRWGQKLHDAPIPWDGNFNGEPQPIGVYAFIAVVVNPLGQKNVISGDVTLIR